MVPYVIDTPWACGIDECNTSIPQAIGVSIENAWGIDVEKTWKRQILEGIQVDRYPEGSGYRWGQHLGSTKFGLAFLGFQSPWFIDTPWAQGIDVGSRVKPTN